MNASRGRRSSRRKRAVNRLTYDDGYVQKKRNGEIDPTQEKENGGRTIERKGKKKKNGLGGLTLAIAVIVCGTLSTAAYEQINIRDRGCGNLITLCEYLLMILLDGSFLLSEPRSVPLRFQIVVLCGFLGYSLLCNFALAMSLPVTVLLILKNGGMVADVCVGFLVMGRRYRWMQIVAVIAVTVGISVSALAAKQTYQNVEWADENNDLKHANDDASSKLLQLTTFTVGALCIIVALFVRSASGVAQEIVLQRTNGKAQAELRIWRTVLGLPILILLQGSSIAEHASIWLDHEPKIELLDGTSVPLIWIFMAFNMVFDYGTKVLVGRLIFETSALTTSLVLIIMRFVSIVFSSCYVNAPPYPPAWMWIGCFLMFAGTTAYVTEGSKKGTKKRD